MQQLTCEGQALQAAIITSDSEDDRDDTETDSEVGEGIENPLELLSVAEPSESLLSSVDWLT